MSEEFKIKIKVLPLEEAVKLEAKQNIERDNIVFKEEGMGEVYGSEAEAIYEEEARLLLTEYGQGYDPEYPHHYLVQVAA